MRISLSIGGALLALTAFASTADARMGGGGGMGMSSSMSHGGGHGSMSSSIGSPRGFSPDGRTFSPDGRTFRPDGIATRVKGAHWKHPIDSDNGGPDDPPKKTPKGSTQGSGGSGSPQGGGWSHDPPRGHGGGWYDQYGHHHGPWPSGQGTASNGEPAPASRTPR